MHKQCLQKCYPTRQAAKNARRELNKQKGAGITDWYYCTPCSSYHLTTIPKKICRKMKRYSKKKK